VTSNTVQFTNPTTAFVTTGNVEVGGELSVSGDAELSSNLTVSGNATVSQELSVIGNVEIGTANLFVDTTTGRVGVGAANPSVPLHVSSSNFVSDGVGPAASANNVFRVTSTEVDSTLLVGASDTGSYISSFSKANFATERNLILNANGGNVGIGITNPQRELQVNGTICSKYYTFNIYNSIWTSIHTLVSGEHSLITWQSFSVNDGTTDNQMYGAMMAQWYGGSTSATFHTIYGSRTSIQMSGTTLQLKTTNAQRTDIRVSVLRLL
jgi:hypothetical protein